MILPPEVTLPDPNRPAPLLQIARLLITIIGLLIALLGGLTGLALAVILLFSGNGIPVDGAITSLALTVLGLGLGGSLAWHAARAYRQRPSAPFRPRPGWILLVFYIPAIIIGHFLITFELAPALTLPPIHILAAALPPLAVLVFVGRALQGANLRWREIIVQLSGGAFLATSIALIAEVVLGLIVLLLSLFIMALTPAGLGQVEELAAHLQDPIWVQDPHNIQQLLFFPPVLVTLVAVFVFLGPIIEEIGKLLGVALMSYRRPSPAQAFLWGLASGAGFTLIENLFNTTLALEGWILIMILRVGATAMHCLAGGLTALGWQRLLAERRPWKLMGAYALSVAIHAIWNALVIAMTGLSATAFASSAELTQILSGGAIIALAILFLGLALAIFAALIVITYRLRSHLAQNQTNDP